MAAIEATTDNFNELIEGNDMVLIDFWGMPPATSC